MTEKDTDRELGEHDVRIAKLEDRMETLENRVHRHANVTQTNTNDIGVLKNLDVKLRIERLEAWKNWVIGVAAGVAAVFSLIGSYIMRKL